MRYFSWILFNSVSVCFSIEPIKFDFKKGQSLPEFSGSKEKINNFLFMDDLELYGPNVKELDSFF